MQRGASRTAEYVALYRALESTESRRQPLFEDRFAARFLSPAHRVALRISRIAPLRDVLELYADYRAPGARTSAIGRTRFIDEALRRAVSRGAEQVVVLGAGYDCRAHRIPELRALKVFEVDRAATQAEKRRHLATLSERHPGVVYVDVDFGTDDLESKLLQAGWVNTKKTVFLWEGVTNYLNEEAVAGVLRFVATVAEGTVLVFTYVHQGAIDGSVAFEGADRLRRNVQRLGEPWTFGLEPRLLAGYLASFGLLLREDMGADDYRARYMDRGARGLRGYSFYRVAVAEVGVDQRGAFGG